MTDCDNHCGALTLQLVSCTLNFELEYFFTNMIRTYVMHTTCLYITRISFRLIFVVF